jgi:hypothetical protein
MFQSYYKQQILTSRYVTATRFSQRAVTACRSLTRSSAYYHKSSFKKLAAKGRTQQGIKPNVKAAIRNNESIFGQRKARIYYTATKHQQ